MIQKKLDLDPKYLAILQDLFAKHIPNMCVWAYGSRVNSQAHRGSDLDLVIVAPDNTQTAQNDVLTLQAAIKESNIPILIDILDWSLLPNEFKKEIRSNFIIIWEPKQ